MLRQEKGIVIPFDRLKLQTTSPIPSRLLFSLAHGFSRRMLAYNAWLFHPQQTAPTGVMRPYSGW